MYVCMCTMNVYVRMYVHIVHCVYVCVYEYLARHIDKHTHKYIDSVDIQNQEKEGPVTPTKDFLFHPLGLLFPTMVPRACGTACGK